MSAADNTTKYKRINPPSSLDGVPCVIVAVTCAMRDITGSDDAKPESMPTLRSDGYATLQVANKFIRHNLKVTKRTDYKRGERPTLREWFDKNQNRVGPAIICVRGHLIYADIRTWRYYSFFDNLDDEVVTVWALQA